MKVRKNIVRILLIIAGTISLGLGILGVFMPVLPTTPFLLLTAGLYLRSSEKLYQKLINNKRMGIYIRRYRANGGMSYVSKVVSIILMWIMIGVSAFLLKEIKYHIILAVLGAIGTIVMGWVVPTAKNDKQ